MPDKTLAMTFRVTPQFKRMLEAAARLEQRSRTNFIEKLVLDYCRCNGIADPRATSPGPERQEHTK